METTRVPFSSLDGESYISLTTYRKSGKPVATPIWFAEADGKVYALTLVGSGKLKRLAHTPEVEVAACDVRGNIHGEAIPARATVHDADSDTGKYANRQLGKKYGLMKHIFI